MDSEDTQSETGGLEKPDGLDAYLSKKGTVELFSVLTISGKRFSELESLVGISPATLSDRLDEGLDLHLLKLDSEPQDDRQTQRYYAAGYGKEIAKAARRVGIHEMNRQLQQLKADLDSERERVRQRAQRGREQLHRLEQRSLEPADSTGSVDEEMLSEAEEIVDNLEDS